MGFAPSAAEILPVLRSGLVQGREEEGVVTCRRLITFSLFFKESV